VRVPVCIPLADAFQRLLTAHRKPGLCVVCLPAISAFQRHNTQQHSILHYYGLRHFTPPQIEGSKRSPKKSAQRRLPQSDFPR
jgi:hypothetical protein